MRNTDLVYRYYRRVIKITNIIDSNYNVYNNNIPYGIWF